jgi:hypothetical protein
MMQICHAAIRLHHAEVGEYTEMMAKMIFEVGQRQLSADEKESDASKEELPHALENLGILGEGR